MTISLSRGKQDSEVLIPRLPACRKERILEQQNSCCKAVFTRTYQEKLNLQEHHQITMHNFWQTIISSGHNEMRKKSFIICWANFPRCCSALLGQCPQVHVLPERAKHSSRQRERSEVRYLLMLRRFCRNALD